MVEENTTEAISLLLVEDTEINKKLDRMRVAMQVINGFKALVSLAQTFCRRMEHEH